MRYAVEEYLAYFGLEQDPFTPAADPAFFYFTPQFEECLAGVKQAVEARYGISMIFGRCGTGKTSLMRHLHRALDSQIHGFDIQTIPSPAPSWNGFAIMEEICHRFSIEPDHPTIHASVRWNSGCIVTAI